MVEVLLLVSGAWFIMSLSLSMMFSSAFITVLGSCNYSPFSFALNFGAAASWCRRSQLTGQELSTLSAGSQEVGRVMIAGRRKEHTCAIFPRGGELYIY